MKMMGTRMMHEDVKAHKQTMESHAPAMKQAMPAAMPKPGMGMGGGMAPAAGHDHQED